mgnify:CR=1 FL=1
MSYGIGEALLYYGVEIAASIVLTLLGVLGAWLTAKLSKKLTVGAQTIELTNINKAQQEVIDMAEQTVEELQQTVVADLKAAHEDGKLTDIEIEQLKQQTIDLTMQKISIASATLLQAASVDLNTLIAGAAERWINVLKR